MADSDLQQSEPHDPAEELLPWYATGQLDEADRVRLETHLSSCAQCRQQLSVERRLVQEFRAIVPEVESGWSRLRARLESPVPAYSPKAASALRQFWDLVSRPAIAGLAMAQLAFVIVAGSLLFSLSRPVYHALGSAPVPASANLIVIFKPETRIQSIDDTLKSAGASIVEGPTVADAYLLHVAPEKRQLVLSRLQSSSTVQMAQPIDGMAP